MQGVITSTCTKEKTWTRVILYSRMSCWTEILPPLCLYFIHTQKRDLLQTWQKKKHLWSTTNEAPTSCVQPHRALFLFLHRLWNSSIHLGDEGKMLRAQNIPPQANIQARSDLSSERAWISSFWMCVCVPMCVWEFRCSCSAVDVYKWVAPKAIWQSRLTPHRHTTEKPSEWAGERVCVCKHFCLPLLCLAILSDRPRV